MEGEKGVGTGRMYRARSTGRVYANFCAISLLDLRRDFSSIPSYLPAGREAGDNGIPWMDRTRFPNKQRVEISGCICHGFRYEPSSACRCSNIIYPCVFYILVTFKILRFELYFRFVKNGFSSFLVFYWKLIVYWKIRKFK